MKPLSTNYLKKHQTTLISYFFGCLCYAKNNKHKPKFDQKSIKEVLLEILINKDATFFENIFPLKQNTTSNFLDDFFISNTKGFPTQKTLTNLLVHLNPLHKTL